MAPGPETPPTAAPSPCGDCPTCQELKEEEASILAELEAAIAANPSLRADNPKSTPAQWEDYDDAIANNPDFAAPVASANREKKFFSLKEKWECGHEGNPYQTIIERDGNDDEDALLISDIRGICSACMDKWNKLEERDEGVAGGSAGPPGLPTYNQSWNDAEKVHTKTPGDLSDDDGNPSSRTRFGRETNLADHDEGPSKGKGVVNAPTDAGERAESPDLYSDDDDSLVDSDSLSDTSVKSKKQVRIYEPGDSDDDKTGKGKSMSKKEADSDYGSEDDYDSDEGSFSGSDTNEKVKKKRLSFFKLGSKKGSRS